MGVVKVATSRGVTTATLSDLDRVRGVGPGILDAIRAEITVGPAGGDTTLAE